MTRPNLVFILSDDHSTHAISAYGSKITQTPNLDRIAHGGARFDTALCTNGICAPSRAAILTGTYNHVNGVTTLDTDLDNTLWTWPQALQAAGYRTGLFGKWHLGHGPGHDPAGFDEWQVLPGQGHYHNPVLLQPHGRVLQRGGYVTDILTDETIGFIERHRHQRDPFAVVLGHKAPHRSWEPSREYHDYLADVEVPEPATLFDDLDGHAAVVQAVEMRMMDLDPIVDLGAAVPAGLAHDEEVQWRYQRFIKRYVAVVQSMDDNIGRLLDYLDTTGLAANTIVVYSSDQGFFLGEHGWFDKRLMYEEQLTMPLLIQAPGQIEAGTVVDDIVLNIDFAPTLLDLLGVATPPHVQGRSFRGLMTGDRPHDWRTSMYYRYWMHRDSSHRCPAHYGVRTTTHKLICYYNDPLDQPGAHPPTDPIEWELFDLVADPLEQHNLYGTAAVAAIQAELLAELARLQAEVGDEPYPAAV